MKTNRVLIIVGVIALLPLLSGHAAEVDWGAAESNGVGTANGTPLPNGSNDLILLGHFNLTNTQIAANGSNESFLMSNFVQFGSSTIGAGSPNGAGSASDGYWAAISINSSDLLSIQNTPIYYWIFNAPTAGAATQYGIFTGSTSANQTTAAAWKFPDDTAVPSTTTIDLSDVPQNSTGILFGSFGTGLSRDGSSPLYNLATFAAVPEPSILSLVTMGFGGIVFAVRRARRC